MYIYDKVQIKTLFHTPGYLLLPCKYQHNHFTGTAIEIIYCLMLDQVIEHLVIFASAGMSNCG